MEGWTGGRSIKRGKDKRACFIPKNQSLRIGVNKFNAVLIFKLCLFTGEPKQVFLFD